MHQHDAYLPYGGGAVKTMHNIMSPFQGQHLHRWLYASTIKANEGVECTSVMKKSPFTGSAALC